MALQIEPASGYENRPILVTTNIPKSRGFTFLPGTERMYDFGKWAVYYDPRLNISYVVVDLGDTWRVMPRIGKVRLKATKMFLRGQPCCQNDDTVWS